MVVGEHGDVARVVERFGAPRVVDAGTIGMHRWEWDLLRFSQRDGRVEDVTMLIPWKRGLVCIVKPQYPPGIARPPSGGVVPGEALDAAAEREAFEETGLLVRVRRYLTRVTARFHARPGDGAPVERALAEAWDLSFADRIGAWAAENPPREGLVVEWASHVFWCDAVGGALAPRDTREIKALDVLPPRELETRVHARMTAEDLGGFHYRVSVQDAALACAREAGLVE